MLTRRQRELEASKLVQQEQEKSKAKTTKPSPNFQLRPTPATTAPPNPQTNINRRITRRTAAILDSHDKSANPFSSTTGSSSSPKGPTLLDLSDGILSHIFNHIQVIEQRENKYPSLDDDDDDKPLLPPYYSLRYILPLVCKRFHCVSSQPSSLWSSITLSFNARGSSINTEMEHFQAHLFQQWLKPRASAVRIFEVINFNEMGVHPDYLDTWATPDDSKNNEKGKGKGKPARQSKRNRSTTHLKANTNPAPTLATPPLIVSILKMFGENLNLLCLRSCPNLIRDSATLKSMLEAIPNLTNATLYGLPQGINKDAFKPLKDMTDLVLLHLDVPEDEAADGAGRQAGNANNNNNAAAAAEAPLGHINPFHLDADHPTYEAVRVLVLKNASQVETKFIGDHLKDLFCLHLDSPSPTLTNFSDLRRLSALERLLFSDNRNSKPVTFTDPMWIDLSYLSSLNTVEIRSRNDMKLQIRDIGKSSLPPNGFSGLTTVSTLLIAGCAMDVPMRVVGEHDDDVDDDDDDDVDDDGPEPELFNRTCTNAMEGLHHFPNLTTLTIIKSRLCSILPPPGKMPLLPKLTHIDISGNSLVDLPEAFLKNVPALEYLYASGNLFPCIPPGVARLSQLKHLDLSGSMYMEVEGPLDWMLSSGPSIKKSAGYQFVGARQLYSYGPGEFVNEEVVVHNMKSLQRMKVTKSLFRFKESSVEWLVDVKAKFRERGQMVEVEYSK